VNNSRDEGEGWRSADESASKALEKRLEELREERKRKKSRGTKQRAGVVRKEEGIVEEDSEGCKHGSE
jgi:hypothetical protein